MVIMLGEAGGLGASMSGTAVDNTVSLGVMSGLAVGDDIACTEGAGTWEVERDITLADACLLGKDSADIWAMDNGMAWGEFSVGEEEAGRVTGLGCVT